MVRVKDVAVQKGVQQQHQRKAQGSTGKVSSKANQPNLDDGALPQLASFLAAEASLLLPAAQGCPTKNLPEAATARAAMGPSRKSRWEKSDYTVG